MTVSKTALKSYADSRIQANILPPPQRVYAKPENFTKGKERLSTCLLQCDESEKTHSFAHDNDTPPAPFRKGQLVRIVKCRHSRRKYRGKFGEVAAITRGWEEGEWIVYIVFPGRSQAVAFYPSELALILESGLLVGGAA